MTWWRPDSSYDLARPRLAASGKVMSSAYTRDELDAAHESGRTTITRAAAGGAQVQIELTRDEVIELARRWLELQGAEDATLGGWFQETAENVASTQIVQKAGALAGAGSLDNPDDAKAAEELTRWVKIGVVVVGVLGIAWALASVATVARAVRG